ncbi:hypothetical protein FKG94_13315 [Exilibacterium tricleocarpae]|uniref:Uncharacterized protein n=1 Tax=Exilibacterium tricleocarpae TaxID=2591008 RepID=A0A545TLH9_9GAMM|nr:hypothetical protein FKG94_13315 [Exilibacterium tricleocarpae]
MRNYFGTYYRFTDLPIYRFTDLPIYRFTDLPIYRFTDLPIYRFTDLPIASEAQGHRLTVSIKSWAQPRCRLP